MKSKNNEDKFKFEHEKPSQIIIGCHSTPESVAKLLIELTGVNRNQGALVADFAVGVGAISSQLDFNRNVIIGDDLTKKYLNYCQKNLPEIILFNHDVFRCRGMPCYEHLVSKKWKKKVDNYSEELINQQTNGKEIYDEIQTYRGWSQEAIKEELAKKELELKQRTLEFLIVEEKEKKAKMDFPEPVEIQPQVEEVNNKVLEEIAELEKQVKQLEEEITIIEEESMSPIALLKKIKRITTKKEELIKIVEKKQEELREELMIIDRKQLTKNE